MCAIDDEAVYDKVKAAHGQKRTSVIATSNYQDYSGPLDSGIIWLADWVNSLGLFEELADPA